MNTHSFAALGTMFSITLGDHPQANALLSASEEKARFFETRYSRFLPDSFLSSLAGSVGEYEVPEEFVRLLLFSEKIYKATQGKITPLLGKMLSEVGYDAEYSFLEQKNKTPVPRFLEALEILDQTHISLKSPVFFDFGAFGKGFFIDQLFSFFQEEGVSEILVNGSGDIRLISPDPLSCGLEHPFDERLVIGTLSLQTGALCASSLFRRSWGKGQNHYRDPDTGISPEKTVATWALSATALEADALASALFFVTPESLKEHFSFEYCMVNAEHKRQSSPGFLADFF